MPPRMRTRKTTKGLKENNGVVEKTNLKSVGKVTKPTRKALSDKTNSASDDNASIEHPKIALKSKVTSKLMNIEDKIVNTERPHRDRRLPNRFVENLVLKNLSNSKENTSIPMQNMPVCKVSKTRLPTKNNIKSPIKRPENNAETSLVASRPRRLCRLPSKFEEHLTSPNKSITIEPTHSSTPILLSKNSKVNNKLGKTKANENLPTNKKTEVSKKDNNNKINNEPAMKSLNKSNKKLGDNNISKSSADTNNNAKQSKTLQSKRINTQTIREISSKDKKNLSRSLTNVKSVSPKHKNGTSSEKPLYKNLSFIVLDDKDQSSKDYENNLDVYEFTYDPNEEPPPQKKKQKRVVRKKPAKPKKTVLKSIYDENLSKALRALKNVVSQKTNHQITNDVAKSQPIIASNTTSSTSDETVQPSTSGTFKIPEQNHASVRVEDIAADFELSADHHEIDYSPINTHNRPQTPLAPKTIIEQRTESPASIANDPLILRDNNLSFFDDEPVASSSMNMTPKHPHASPWRVEFQTLPIKWRVNSYVKANMTPAMECSFVNFDDNKKKHVYTNMLPEEPDPLPEILHNDEPSLKQTSILFFIKEVVERSASKKKRDRSTTPNRVNSVFDDPTRNQYTNKLNKTPIKVVTLKKSADYRTLTPINNATVDNNLNEVDNASLDKQNSKETHKRKNDSDPNVVPAKTPRKDKENTFFGFDDSEKEDDENVSPHKVNTHRVRDLRPRARAVLKEINAQTGPTRVTLPIAAKSKALDSQTSTKLYEEKKTAVDMPMIPEKSPVENVEAINVALGLETADDDESVHLFEDIDIIHHLKPTRKSYGKAKKVTFRQRSISNSDTQDSEMPRAEREDSGEEDDLADLTFEIPTVKEKKVTKKKSTKKQKLSKKEKQEADAWAAGFNSMCEDIDDFPLLVE